MLAMMSIDKIRIPNIYTQTPPRKEKIDDHMAYYLVYLRYSVKSIQSLLVGVLIVKIGR